MSFHPLRFQFTTNVDQAEQVTAYFEREMSGCAPDRDPAFWGDEVKWTLDMSLVCAAEPDDQMGMLKELMDGLKAELDGPHFQGWDKIECGGEEVVVRHHPD